MSSSDESTHKVTKKSGKKTEKTSSKHGVEYQIKPSNGGPSMDTSNWPLLLKVSAKHLNIPIITLFDLIEL